MQRITTIFVFSCTVLAGVLFASTAYAGFGITPPYIRNDTLTRGSKFTREIILVRGDPVEDIKVEITFDLPGISDWVTIDRGTEFVMPAGEKQVPMNITVQVPEDAKYGNYTGHIRVRTSSADGPTAGSVSIALGAQIDVDLRVVDQVVDFKVRRVELNELEEGYRKWWLDYPGKITLLMHIQNTGNVPVAPSRVELDIYDRKGETLLETTENLGDIRTVEPFQTGKVKAYLPTWLKAGGYLVKFRIYKGQEVVRTGELTLSILPHGTVPDYVPYGIAGVRWQGANILVPLAAIFEGLSWGDRLSLIIPSLLLMMGLFVLVLYYRGVFARSVASRRATGGTGSGVGSNGRAAPIRRPVQARTVKPIVRAHGGVIDLSRK